MIRYLWSRFLSLKARYGILGALKRAALLPKVLGHIFAQKSYQNWVALTERDSARRLRLESGASANFSYRPVISVLLPTYKSNLPWLRECVESVLKQSYPQLELCIADDHSEDAGLEKYLTELSRRDARVKIVFRPTNGHICANTNSALALATGEFVAFLDHDDKLHRSALFEVVSFLNSPAGAGADFIYSDEDKFDDSGLRSEPARKPDFNGEKLFETMYTGHLAVYRRTLIEKLGGLRVGFEGAQDWDLILRAAESPLRIRHLPKILYHWRKHPGSTSDHPLSKPYAHEASLRAIRAAFERRGLKAELLSTPAPGFYKWKLEGAR